MGYEILKTSIFSSVVILIGLLLGFFLLKVQEN